jgi:hypothetical protein
MATYMLERLCSKFFNTFGFLVIGLQEKMGERNRKQAGNQQERSSYIHIMNKVH